MAKQIERNTHRNTPENETVNPTDFLSPATSQALDRASPVEERLARANAKLFVFEKREKLVPGRPVTGIFLGAGPYVWVEDPNDSKQENRINTWRIQIAENMVVQIPGTAQLNSRLVTYPINDDIQIMLLAEKGESKRGRRFSDHLISNPDSPEASPAHTVVEPVQKRPRSE